MIFSKVDGRQSSANEQFNSPGFLSSIRAAIVTVFESSKQYFGNQFVKARHLGISVKQTVIEYLDLIFIFISSYVSEKFSSLLTSLKQIVYSQIDFIVSKIQESINETTSNFTNVIISCISLIVLVLAIAIPSSSVSIAGRFALAILSALIFFTKSYLSVAVTGFFLVILSKLSPSSSTKVETTINFTKATPQSEPLLSNDVKRDAKTLLKNVFSTGILLSAATAGVDIPTDGQSWEKLLRRHSLIQRSYQFWEFGAEKLAELCDESARIVCKYVYGKEYTSFRRIEEIDELLYDVFELSSLDAQHRIGKDEEMSLKIELMYSRYLTLRNAYSGNQMVSKKLDIVSAPLTAYYRRVTNKNPRANAMRKEPVVIMLRGGTGLGKTYLSTAFQQDLLKICGRYRPDDCLSGQIYARNIEQEFWDGYTGQPIVVYDDFGQMIDSPNKPNLEYFEIVRGSNVFPYMLHSAELADKANNPFMAEFMYLTTNHSVIKPKSVHYPEAVRRRIHIDRELKVKEQFLTDTEPKMLDVQKLNQYRLENDLKENDFSHLQFESKDGIIQTYDELIVEISKVYLNHVNNFAGRKNLAELKRSETLPRGAFSIDSKWINNNEEDSPFTRATAQGEKVYRCSTATFFNQEKFIQKQMLQQGFKILNTQNLSIRPCDNIEELQQLIDDYSIWEKHFEFHNKKEVDHKILTNFAFNRLSKLERDFKIQTRLGELNKEQIPELTKAEFDDLRKFEESLKDEHVNPDNSNPYDWCPLHETWFRYFMRKFLLLTHKALYSENPYWQRFVKMVKWYVIFCGLITLFTTLYSVYSQSGLWSSEEAVEDPLLAFYYRRQAGMSVALAYSCYMSTIADFMYSQQILNYYSIGAAILTLYQYCVHRHVHRLTKKDCDTCQRFAPLKKFKSEGDDFVNLKECLAKLEKDVKQCDNLPESQFNAESPMRVDRRRNIVSYEDNLSQPQESQTHKVQPESPSKQQVNYKKVSYEMDPVLSDIFGKSQVKATSEGILSSQCHSVMHLSMKSAWKMFVKYDGKEFYNGRATCIKGSHYLINIHYVENVKLHLDACEDKETFRIGFRQFGKELILWTSLDHLMNGEVVKRGMHNTEFVIFTLPKEFPKGVDLTKHLIKTDELGKLDFGVRLTLLKVSEVDTKFLINTKEGIFTHLDVIQLESEVPGCPPRIYPESARYSISTEKGDCGCPVFINNDMFTGKILGFHFGGTEGGGTCSIITFRDIMHLVKDEICSAPSIAESQSDMNTLPCLAAPIVGVVKQPVTHPCSSTLRRSCIYECFGPSEMAPALLRPALEEDGPLLLGLQKYNIKETFRIDPHILELAYRDFHQSCIRPSVALGYEKRLLTFDEAVKGIEGNQYICGLKRSKSAGYPYMLSAKKGKTDWFGSGDWDLNNPFCDQLRKDCQRLENECRNGIIPDVIFVATLKDEKRSYEKIAKKATRVFAASPLHFTIIFRKYFSGFLAFMMRNKISAESCVGTNVHGPDWHRIYKKICKHPLFLAGDFANFDGDLIVDIMFLILRTANEFYSDGNDLIRECLWHCLIHSKQLIHHIVVQFFNGQPSGNPGTAIINSIYSSLLFRVIFYSFKFPFPFKFHQMCSLVTYGDDHILSVHESLKDYVTPFSIKEAMSYFGHGYTDCYKNQITLETSWSHIEDVSFLKRKFVCEGNYTFAPLELRSIREMVNWVHKSSSIVAATEENVLSAMRELVHYDKPIFENYCHIMCSAMSKHGISIPRPHYDLQRYEMRQGIYADSLTDGPWV